MRLSNRWEYDVFLSYNRTRDASVAHEIATALGSAGLSVFFDVFSLDLGEDFAEAIDEALLHTSYFAVLTSPHQVSSPWARRELATAGDVTAIPSDHIIEIVIDGAQPLFPTAMQIAIRSDDHQSIASAAAKIASRVTREGRTVTGGPPQEAGDQIPALDHRGLLPAGVHHASLSEVIRRFGRSNDQRRALGGELRAIAGRAEAMGATALLVGGSFITKKPHPGDLDVVIAMPDDVAEDRIRPHFYALDTYVSQRQRTYVSVGKSAYTHWLGFLSNDVLGERRGVVHIDVPGGLR